MPIDKKTKVEVKVVKDEAFEKFWENFKAQSPAKAEAFEKSGEVEKIKADFAKSIK